MNRLGGMQARLMMAALTRRPGMVALAVIAVAIGASVAAALLHVSADVSRKLTRELRVLGPNLVLLPDPSREFLDQKLVGERLQRVKHVEVVGILYVTAKAGNVPVRVIGATERLYAIHRSWSYATLWWPHADSLQSIDMMSPRSQHAWIGRRLARRLGIMHRDSLTLSFPATGRTTRVEVQTTFESGGIEDECLVLPLPQVQALTGRIGEMSRVEMRVEGDAVVAQRIVTALERGGGLTARVRYALSRTEADLLERMRRLMTLVTITALLSAGLCAFGTLTDLALERRREIALLKTLGATRLEIVRQFALESLAIGLTGGLLGWAVGALFAQVIGRRVFESAIALRPDVPLMVMGLATLVAVAAGLGPIRLALGVDPARVLKGD